MISIVSFVLIVALALALAGLNHLAWEKGYIGFWWHTTQWLGLALFALAYTYFTDDYYALLLVWSAIHWWVFEGVLYRLRGLPFRYVGYTAQSDKLIRFVASYFVRWFGGTETAQAGTVKMWFKSWYLIGALVAYHLSCGC